MTNNPLGGPGREPLPPEMNLTAEAALAHAFAIVNAQQTIARAVDLVKKIDDPVSAEVARLTDGADLGYIGARIKAEATHLERFYRAYRKRDDVDAWAKAVTESSLASLRLSATSLVLNDTLGITDAEPGLDYDSWDEYVEHLAGIIVELRDAFGAEPGPLYMRAPASGRA